MSVIYRGNTVKSMTAGCYTCNCWSVYGDRRRRIWQKFRKVEAFCIYTWLHSFITTWEQNEMKCCMDCYHSSVLHLVHFKTVLQWVSSTFYGPKFSTHITWTFSAAFCRFFSFLVMCFCIVHFQSTHCVDLKAFRKQLSAHDECLIWTRTSTAGWERTKSLKCIANAQHLAFVFCMYYTMFKV